MQCVVGGRGRRGRWGVMISDGGKGGMAKGGKWSVEGEAGEMSGETTAKGMGLWCRSMSVGRIRC
jgi:hypothetical protein